MEKQTKILLGVGAAIAAYLILKPKKAVAQTVTPQPSNPVEVIQSGLLNNGTCPDGYTYNSSDGQCLPLEPLPDYVPFPKYIDTVNRTICPEGYYYFLGYCQDNEGNKTQYIDNPNYNEDDARKMEEKMRKEGERLKGDPVDPKFYDLNYLNSILK
jgi:hypothetical protein